MDDQIVIYSDFDGVYNIPESPQTVTAAVATQHSKYLARKNTIAWNPGTVAMLRQLLGAGDFQFIWHTTWNHGGNIRLAAEAMGLPQLMDHTRALLNDRAPNRKEWTRWKAESIIQDQEANPRPFIWIDDKAPIFWEDHVKGHTRAPSLVVKTNSRDGLLPEDFIRIIDWTLGLRRGAGATGHSTDNGNKE